MLNVLALQLSCNKYFNRIWTRSRLTNSQTSIKSSIKLGKRWVQRKSFTSTLWKISGCSLQALHYRFPDIPLNTRSYFSAYSLDWKNIFQVEKTFFRYSQFMKKKNIFLIHSGSHKLIIPRYFSVKTRNFNASKKKSPQERILWTLLQITLSSVYEKCMFFEISNWDTSTLGQVSSCDDMVLKIYLHCKF